MVNETILGGLKSALVRGESLKRAMMTLYNAGYSRDEIYEAARAINEGGGQLQSQTAKQPVLQPTKPKKKSLFSKKQPSKEKKPEKPLPQTQPSLKPVNPVSQKPLKQLQIPPTTQQSATQQQIQQAGTPSISQNVSAYGQPEKPKSKTPIILLAVLLLILIGGLVTIFLFKEDLLGFFSSMFS